MPLTLGIHKNSVIYFGATPVKVLAVEGYKQATLQVGEQTYTVYDDKATEILPKVFVSCGLPHPLASDDIVPMPRLLIEAPRSMTILRKELYGKPRPERRKTLPHPARPRYQGT